MKVVLVGVDDLTCIGCATLYGADAVQVFKFWPQVDLELRYGLCAVCSLSPNEAGVLKRVFDRFESERDLELSGIKALDVFEVLR